MDIETLNNEICMCLYHYNAFRALGLNAQHSVMFINEATFPSVCAVWVCPYMWVYPFVSVRMRSCPVCLHALQTQKVLTYTYNMFINMKFKVHSLPCKQSHH